MRTRGAFGALCIVTVLALCAIVVPAWATAAQDEVFLSIGVIGGSDSDTARGVSLAVEQVNATGPITLPDGRLARFSVVVVDARTPAEVSGALAQLLQTSPVAIFGPDDNFLAAQNNAVLAGAGVPVFTGATSSAVTPGGFLFRTQAPDRVQLGILGGMVGAVQGARIVLYQGDETFSSQTQDLNQALAQRGVTPSGVVVQGAGNTIQQVAQSIIDGGAGAVIAVGQPVQVADLLRTLRALGFGGAFGTPVVADRAFIDSVPFQFRGNLPGVAGWTYIYNDPESVAFSRSYAVLFGEVAGPLSAAAYDGASLLIAAVRAAGTVPEAVRARIVATGSYNGVQGVIDPSRASGDLSLNAAGIVTGPYGAAVPVVRFDDTRTVPLDVAGLPTPGPSNTPRPTQTSTATRTPTITSTPSQTPVPTATLEGVWATVRARALNVRGGPGVSYETLGQLRRGEQVRLLGANPDLTWFVIQFRSQMGWISGGTAFITITGDPRTLPIVQPPPTPTLPPTLTPSLTPTWTLTPTAAPFPDLVLVSASLNPALPQPGQPFTVLLNLQNAGQAAAGEFAVAATFEPGGVYTSAIVPGLGPGVQTVVPLNVTVAGTGNFTVAIVLDLNQQVDEGPAGEANNQPPFSYRVDRAYIAQGSFQVAPTTNVDFYGSTADATYDGLNLTPINGALINILAGVQLNQVHYDYLTSAVVNNAAPISQASLAPGTILGIQTAEGQRGVLRVAGYNGSSIILEYYVYTP